MTFPKSRFLRHAATLAAAVLVACSDPVGSDTPYVVVPITTAALSGTPGWALADTLVVEVRDAQGHPVPGASVTWALPQGGSLEVELADASEPMKGTTDDQGRSRVVWTLGLPEGAQSAQASSGTGGTPATFVATSSALHATAVAVGKDYACAILEDETVACWGGNVRGQLGVGDVSPRALPTTVSGPSGVRELAASNSSHTCAVDATRAVWCWGANFYGEAGSAAAQPMQLVPVLVPGAAGASALALGGSFSCAVLDAGGGHCWGTNTDMRMGTGGLPTGGSSYPAPTPVIGGSDFTGFGLDWDRGCAVDSTWELWCWGNAWGGEYSPYAAGGYNSAIQPVPGQKFSSAAVNLLSTCGVGLGGSALCFGVNVGLGDESGPTYTLAPVVVLSGVSFRGIVTDGGRFYGASTDGRLFMWGILDCCGGSPAIPGEIPLPVLVADVAAGDYGYCVIAEGGALYCDPYADGVDGLEAYPVP